MIGEGYSMRGYFERMRGGLFLSAGLVLAVTLVCSAPRAEAEDALLAETVEFTGFFIHLTAKSPGLVIGAIRNGETVVRGYGEIADGSGKAPDGDTRMRIGSITKAFTGATLAPWLLTARCSSPTSSTTGSAGT